ncbi:helix-turn-helix domain-containing protein [Okeania sp.]|uniref:helix-turn-helix domain-containing protein n=1 Tax=Okeania sp. TaxID=3100323 RepID=UPI002B4B3EB3|nr:helix-turn-helix domain-containing protein [Okeania sp.]MEB3340778.1 helix-turn-helix domain-containing protein [Okeania sp.]
MQSIKTKLKVNNKQKRILAKHAGVARHAYNWGLATCITEYEETCQGKADSRPGHTELDLSTSRVKLATGPNQSV